MSRWSGLNQGLAAVTPVISASPDYTAGDCVGGLNSITNAVKRKNGSGYLLGMEVTDKSGQIGANELVAVFFKENPSASTFTDNAAFAINAADVAKVIAHVSFSTTLAEHTTGGSGISLAYRELFRPYVTAAGVLYVAFKTLGANNHASTSDIVANIMLGRD